jgi:hypothetical protein
MSDAIKQLSFHVDLNGCPVPEPAYVKKVRTEYAKPIPFPDSYLFQLPLFDGAPEAPAKKSRRKKAA